MTGTMTLTGTSRHSVEEIEGAVSCSVPIVGGRLATFVGRTAAGNLVAEHAFAERWLATRTG
jgi:hypothetical protein